MNEEDKGKIEGLNEKLYSRTKYKDPTDKRRFARQGQGDPEESGSEVGGRWQDTELDDILKRERIPKEINPIMKKFFIFALIFFVATVIVSVFVFFGGTNFVSSKNVDINVLGPTTISAGDVLELGVSVSNKNNADLELANFSIQYPSGTRNPDNTSETLTFTKDELGVIPAGGEAIRNVSMTLLGSTGEVKTIKFSIEYKVKGSNALFYKDKIFEVLIGETPITLDVDSASSVTSGESFNTLVSVTLNSQEILRDVVLKAEYPHGYSEISSDPGSLSEGIWSLGDMTPGDEKKVSIRGRLLGEDREERTFRFYVGVSDQRSSTKDLRIPITSLLNTIEILRPSLGLSAFFNNNNVSTYLVPAARPVTSTLKFQNNMPDKLLNPRLEVRFSGSALDPASVAVSSDGSYDQSNSRIIWDLRNLQGNTELLPGQGGEVSFQFASLGQESISGSQRDIDLDISLSGVSIIGQAPIVVNESRTVRVSSEVSLSAKALRSTGPFSNHGPIPPRAEEETTYTIVLSLGNTRGNMSEARVTTKLGQGVEWIRPTSGGENITYDSASGNLAWDIGILPSGTGFSSSPRELKFQVSLTPAPSQIGTVPTLLSAISFTGRDISTGETSVVNHPTLTTRLTNDPAFIQGDDIVVE